MKIVTYIFCFICLFGKAQDNVETPCQFPAGIKAMIDFIVKNQKNPKSVPVGDDHLKTITKFIVDTSGVLRDYTIDKTSGNKELDSEALRIIKLMPKWEVARQNGRKVETHFTLPFAFSVNTKVYETSRNVKGQFVESLERANKMYEVKDYASAKKNYLIAFKANSLNSEVFYNLADSYLHLSKKDSACYYWNMMNTMLISNKAKEALSKSCN